jgi:hypothetical protein
MARRSAQEKLAAQCGGCHADLYLGLARCRNCGALRPEFQPHAAIVAEELGRCCLSGALSDVCLPTGEYLWAPYFLDYLTAGWLDERYRYTAAFRATHQGLA